VTGRKGRRAAAGLSAVAVPCQTSELEAMYERPAETKPRITDEYALLLPALSSAGAEKQNVWKIADSLFGPPVELAIQRSASISWNASAFSKL
jgi:hypothetical protein